MEEPNYENYSRSELESVLSNIDATKYPERAARVRTLLDAFEDKNDVVEEEQGFWGALFGKDIESIENAKKILKATFLVCLFQLLLLVVLRLFLPDVYSKTMSHEVIAFTSAGILAGLGWLIHRQYMWATYVVLCIVLAPNLLIAFDEKSLPDFSFLEIVLVFLLFSSIRSIKFIKASEKGDIASKLL